MRFPKIPTFVRIHKRKIVILPILFGFLGGIIIAAIVLLGWRYVGKTIYQPKSTLQVDIHQNTIDLSFGFSGRDRQRLESLSHTLGMGTDWMRGISLEVTDETKAYIESVIPQYWEFRVLQDSIVFGTTLDQNTVQHLTDALSDQTMVASSSGKIAVNNLSDDETQIVIENPSGVLAEATQSGKLKISPTIFNKLWPLTLKLDRITIKKDKDGEVKGEIELR
jgi:hypothetical protein